MGENYILQEMIAVRHTVELFSKMIIIIFRRFHKITENDYYIRSVCLSVRMEQLSSHRTDSYEISYLSIFRKSVAKVQIIRGDSFARGPNLLSIKNYVNQ